MKYLALTCALLILVSCVLSAQTNPVPFINQPLVPETVAPGSGGFTLTIHGAGFAPTAVVKWNGSVRQTAVLSTSLLQATIMASDVANAGTAPITVVNVDANNETSNVAYFTVRKSAPTVAMIASPNFTASGVVAAGDFNKDGKLDIAVCNVNGTTLVVDVYLNQGQLKFAPPVESAYKFNSKVFRISGPIIVGDFNNDHKLDLALRLNQKNNNNAWQIVTLLGNGKGKFTLGPISGGGNILAPAGDINGDGNLDLMTTGEDARTSTGSVVVLSGIGDGSFGGGGSVTFLSDSPGTPVVGDFNEDGLLDIAVTSQYSNRFSIVVALNQGGGTFQDPVSYPISPASSLLTADINGDGHLDLITDAGGVFLGKGDGTFTSGQSIGSGGIILSGDFNGDGKLDLVSSGGFGLALGNGDGTVQPTISMVYGSTNFTGSIVATGDFNHDGHLDLVGSGGLLWQVSAGLAPSGMGFGQQLVGTKSQAQTATLVNAGSTPLLVTQIGINGTDSAEFSQTNNCPSSVPVGSSCQIQVTFAPKTKGDKSAALTVTYTGPGSPQSVALSGTGVGTTSVTLTPSTLTFATRIVNTTSAPKIATLTNTGSEDILVSSISTAPPFTQTNNCPSTLSAGQSCKIQVIFQPTTIGLANGTLSVTDNAPDSPQTVALSGVGTKITFSPIGLTFGNQKVGTSSNPVPVTLTNQGTVTLKISKIAIGGTNPTDFSQTNNCGTSVPAGGGCTIQVTFAPKQKAQRSAKLLVNDDVKPSPQGMALGGTGT